MKAVRTVALFIAAALVCGSGAASTFSLISSHVPVFSGETDESAIRELEFMTWFALPEARIQAVLWPYKVNSPHEQSDGININPASMVNLRILPELYPHEKCLITLDVEGMTNLPSEIVASYGKSEKLDLVHAVIEATRRNLLASKIDNCALVVEGASRHHELREAVFPAMLKGS